MRRPTPSRRPSRQPSAKGFERCVYDGVTGRVLHGDEAEEILSSFREYTTDLGLSNSAAQERVAAERDAIAATQRRQKLLQDEKKRKIDEHLVKHLNYRGKHDVIGAAYGLFEDFGWAGTTNARFFARSVEARGYSKISDALERYHRSMFAAGGRKHMGEMGDLQRAMFGETTSPEIQSLAKDLLDACDWARRMFNDRSGNTIPKLEKWGGPQPLDPFAVQNAGGAASGIRHKTLRPYDPAAAKAAFASDVRDELDWSKMRDPWTSELYGETVPSLKEKNRIMDAVWKDVVLGRDFQPEMKAKSRNSVANARSDHRFLVYKDAEAKMRVMEKYGRGRGDVVGSVIHYIQSMSRDIALMEVFGPNPAATTEYLKQFIHLEAQAAGDGKPTLAETLKGVTPGKAMVEAEKAKKIIDGYYRQFRGEDQSIGNIGLAGTVLRNWDMGSLIGSAVIPHFFMNPTINMSARYMGGMPIFHAIPHLVRSMAGATQGELLRAGLDFSQGAFDIGRGARQLDAMRRIARWSRHLPDKATKVSGLEVFIKASKLSFARDMAALMGDLQSTAWDSLPQFVRDKLIGYGHDEFDWKLIQMAKPYQPAVGSAPWITPREVAQVGITRPEDVLNLMGHDDLLGHDLVDEDGAMVPFAQSREGLKRAAQIAENVALKFGAYFAGENEVSTPQSSMRVRAAFTGGTRPDSVLGFTARSMYMFHSFQGSMWHSQLTGWAHRAFGRATRGRGGKAALVVFLVAMAAGGIISYILKNWRSTKTTPLLSDRRTWIQGALNAFALPMLGDFVSSDLWGVHGTGIAQDVWSGLGGPAVSDIMGLINEANKILMYSSARHRHELGLGPQLGLDVINAARMHTPVISNLWYAQAPYNRMLLDQAQSEIDPWSHYDNRNREQKLMKRTGQSMWWKPGEMWPSFAPWDAPP